MVASDPPAGELDTWQARRLVGTLGLRPGERVFCLGHGDGVAARLAAYLVGPTGQVVEAEYHAGGALPYLDGEFDAVLTEVATAADPDPTRMLAEIARVTAPTGRVAIAVVPPADGDSASVSRYAHAAGLRGINLQPIAGTGTEPALLLTAFPPRPATGPAAGVAEPATAELAGGAVRDRLQTTMRMVPRFLTGRVGGRRGRLAAASVAVMLVAVAIGVGWGLAGTDDPGAGAGPEAGTGLAGDAGPDGLPPDLAGEEDDPAGGAGPLGEDSGSGSGSGSSGGGAAGNRPPVIEDAGLSSDGLTLTITPAVTDPDDDRVTLAAEADGQPVPLSGDPARGTVSYNYQTHGPEHEASVTIVATDPGGASAQETFSHLLQAVTTVTVENLMFTVAQPNNCLGGEVRARRLVGTIALSGPVEATVSIRSQELRLDRTQITLLDRRQGEQAGAGEQRVRVRATFAGATSEVNEVHGGDRNVIKAMFTGTDGCRGLLSYRVDFQRR